MARYFVRLPRHAPVSGCRWYTQAATQVRVRFAPSPTGQLHLGGVRTALYNRLFAASHGGRFILRIEDTDQTRVVPGADQKLMEMLDWLGIHVDEGPAQGGDYGPYVQSQRTAIYRDMIHKLLANGSAYPCFCTEKRLGLMRKAMLQRGETPQYDNRCRSLSAQQVEDNMRQGLPYVVRLRLEPYLEPWRDLVYGPIKQDPAASECDPILMKSDGYPTYHFANVVDDHLMEITHVLRGVEWQASTAKHLLLYRAFGWTPPCFGHIPVLVNRDGKKLSKRQNDMHVEHFKNEGHDPAVLINWLCYMSSGFTRPREELRVLNVSQLADCFDVGRLRTNPSRLDFTLLDQFRTDHLMALLNEERAALVRRARQVIQERLQHRRGREVTVCDDRVENILIQTVGSRRIVALHDLAGPEYDFLWDSEVAIDRKQMLALSRKAGEILTCVADTLAPLQPGGLERVGESLGGVAKERGYGYAAVMKLVRLALYGKLQGPSIPELLAMLGKDIAIQRLRGAAEQLSETQSELLSET